MLVERFGKPDNLFWGIRQWGIDGCLAEDSPPDYRQTGNNPVVPAKSVFGKFG